MSYHPRDRSSVHYGYVAQNNCLTGWKDESRGPSLLIIGRVASRRSQERRDSRHASRIRGGPFRCHPVALGRRDKIKDSSVTEPSTVTVRYPRKIVKPAGLVISFFARLDVKIAADSRHLENYKIANYLFSVHSNLVNNFLVFHVFLFKIPKQNNLKTFVWRNFLSHAVSNALHSYNQEKTEPLEF